MNAFEALALAFGLTYLVHSTLLLVAAWLVERWVRSVRLREALWRAAFFGGVVTAGLQVAVGPPAPGAGRWSVDSLGRAPRTAERPIAAPAEGASDLAALPAFRAAELRLAAPAPGPEPTPRAPETPIASRALALWLAAAGLLHLLAGRDRRRLRAVLRGRVRVDEGPLPGLLAHLRRQAGTLRPVSLYAAPRLATPLAMGVLRPRIVIPERARQELPRDLQASMLAHELAHLARLDPLWLALARGVETALFFQPLNRLAHRRLRETAELSCDDWAVRHTGDRIGLARCLTSVASWIVGAPRLAACGMAGRRSLLAERVDRILARGERSERGWRGALPAGAVGLLATALFAPGFAAGDAPASAPFGTEAPVASSAPPASTLAGEPLLASLEAALRALESEVAHLAREAEKRRLPGEVLARLDEIEHRAAMLRARKDRLQDRWGAVSNALATSFPREPR